MHIKAMRVFVESVLRFGMPKTQRFCSPTAQRQFGGAGESLKATLLRCLHPEPQGGQREESGDIGRRAQLLCQGDAAAARKVLAETLGKQARCLRNFPSHSCKNSVRKGRCFSLHHIFDTRI